MGVGRVCVPSGCQVLDLNRRPLRCHGSRPCAIGPELLHTGRVQRVRGPGPCSSWVCRELRSAPPHHASPPGSQQSAARGARRRESWFNWSLAAGRCFCLRVASVSGGSPPRAAQSEPRLSATSIYYRPAFHDPEEEPDGVRASRGVTLLAC